MERCVFGHDINDDTFRTYRIVNGEIECICMEHDAQIFHGEITVEK